MKLKAKRFPLYLMLVLMFVVFSMNVMAVNGLENFKKIHNFTPGQFVDVEANSWFAGNVQSAFELGLIKGSSENTFSPDGNLTIAESIALACRIHDIYHGGEGIFT